MRVECWNEQKEDPLDEAALTRYLQGLGYEVTRYVYPPGTYFGAHTHAEDKIDAVLAGRFRLTMEDQQVVLTTGQWAKIPAGAPHTAEVLGSEPVISLDGVKHA